jgi:very-short-patch-repair endonuclease
MPRQGTRRRPESPRKPGRGVSPHRKPGNGDPPSRKPGNGVPPAPTNALTEALWEQLREHRCNGFRFQRQATVLGGIAEFYCAAARLVVQVVGKSRRVAIGADALNDLALAGAGLRVLRVPAGVVARDPRTAARIVAEALMESGHAPGPARAPKGRFGPGPVGDVW